MHAQIAAVHPAVLAATFTHVDLETEPAAGTDPVRDAPPGGSRALVMVSRLTGLIAAAAIALAVWPAAAARVERQHHAGPDRRIPGDVRGEIDGPQGAGDRRLLHAGRPAAAAADRQSARHRPAAHARPWLGVLRACPPESVSGTAGTGAVDRRRRTAAGAGRLSGAARWRQSARMPGCSPTSRPAQPASWPGGGRHPGAGRPLDRAGPSDQAATTWGMAWSPDDRTLAFVGPDPSTGRSVIKLVSDPMRAGPAQIRAAPPIPCPTGDPCAATSPTFDAQGTLFYTAMIPATSPAIAAG